MKDLRFKFEDLKVYQKALDFVDFAYDVSDKFPNTERYGLISQFTRASLSIALNIAEGSADTDKQFHRFLQMALDSLNECVVCSSVAKRQNYITKALDYDVRLKLVELSKMITSLKKYLNNKNNSNL
jgi:four helix bundle protein